MKTQFLDGPSLADELPRLVRRSNGIDIAMAYIKRGGLATLLKSANALIDKGKPVRIVFGLAARFGITDWEAADDLLKLSKRCHNVTVKKLDNCGFHPKLLIFHGSPVYIAVGSANLTEAAQSTNAEANLLVENPDAELLRDAVQFFGDYFTKAPRLTRKHVDDYKRRVSKRKMHEGAGSADGDVLPSPRGRKHDLVIIKPRALWKIAPGKDADRWHEWAQSIGDDGDGIVAMGWNEVGSLDRFKNDDDLERVVAQKAEEVWNKEWDRKTDVKHATKQLWAFRKDVKEGDVFIVYSETRVLGVATVTAESKYYYNPSSPISFAHQMNVRYKWYKEWPPRADDRIIGTLGKQGTLLPITEPGFWRYLVSKLP